MKSTRIDIHPLPASDFAGDWRVFSITAADRNMKALERALGGASKQRPNELDFDEDRWAKLMGEFLARFDDPGGIDTLWFALLSETDRLALRARVSQARRALKYATGLHASGANATTTLLLPTAPRARAELLLGYGQMPLAWLIRLNVTKF